MPIEFDVAVLGGGMAGSAAAICAAARGARVLIMSGPPGTTAMFSGAWRGACPDALHRELALSGYELSPCSQPLPHPTGALIGCDYTHRSHLAAQISDGALVVGVAGLPGFEPPALAEQWSARSGFGLQSATIMLDPSPAAGWAPASIASLIQRSPDIIIAPLLAVLKQHPAARVIVPAILGLRPDAATHMRVEDAVARPIGEALAVPPSLPGWRLHLALRDAVARAGVTIVEARAVAGEHMKGRIDSIRLSNGDVVHARTYILATGKYAAGGIEADGTFCEPAFGCPVWVDHLGERFAAADSLLLTDPDRTQDQPLLRAGVHADAEQRPVDPFGDVVYSNVRVAGSVRSDWSITTHGIGDAATDGWAAGLAVTA